MKQKLLLTFALLLTAATGAWAQGPNIVTKENFSSYFDGSGNLLNTVTSDALIFQGEFSGSDLVNYITLDKTITITGDNAVLNNIGFVIAADGVTLQNMTLVATSNLGNMIDIAGENAVISKLDITYTVNQPVSRAINVFPGTNGTQILNNKIYFESTVNSYAVDEVTTAICVDSGVSFIDDDEDPIEDLVIDGNEITAVIPAFLPDIYEHEYWVMGISAVNGVRINGAEDFTFTNNTLNVTTNRLDNTTPTFQAMYVASSSGLIKDNKISMIDTFTPAGKDVYLYAIELIKDEGLTIFNNDFKISTTGGKEEAGIACAILAIDSDFSITKNTITTESKGPNYAVYFPSGMGAPCDVVISDNTIKVTGLATSAHDTSLVTGIEIETGDVEISDNTIYTYNIGEYAEANYIYGISYAQNGTTPDVEITNNTIYTEGKYAISFLKVDDAKITDNTLCAHILMGDNAVSIASGSGNTVEDNHPTPVEYEGGNVGKSDKGYFVNLTEDGDNPNPGPLPNDDDLAELTYGRTLAAPGSAEGSGDTQIDDKPANLFTICLPFAPKTDDAVKYYTLSGVSGETVNFDEVAEPVANTPYLIAVSGTSDITESCKFLEVSSMTINSTTIDGYTFNGTFTGLTNAEAEGKYILQSNNKWGKVTTENNAAFIPPFRAFIEAPASGARQLSGSFDGSATGIKYIRTQNIDGTERYFDLNGRRIEKPTTKGIYIHNGKKVVIK